MFFSFASFARIKKMNKVPKRNTLSEAKHLARGSGWMKELLIQSPLNLCPLLPFLPFFLSLQPSPSECIMSLILLAAANKQHAAIQSAFVPVVVTASPDTRKQIQGTFRPENMPHRI